MLAFSLALGACGNGSESVATGASTPSSSPGTSATTTLRASVSKLALSVTGLTEYGVAGTPASGRARIVTITNTGSAAATGLAIAVPALPSGTVDSGSCGSTLAAGSTCTLTVTPGATASGGVGPCTTGTAPTPAAISVGGSNTNTVSVDVVVLGYGCIYQGGYVYALDDTTPSTGSVGGKVLSQFDEASALVWSTRFDAIYGISETSTAALPSPSVGAVAGQSSCDGATDGACDSANIVDYYTSYAIGAPIALPDYAAGVCEATIASESDWHLPAICEMGYGGAGCGTSASPTEQNVQSDLVDSGGAVPLNGNYWSSTEASFAPANGAWVQSFMPGGDSTEELATKGLALAVRCTRALTP